MTQPIPETDGQLLAQFCSDRSQAAFAELVNRHGTMVHGVALRVLADHHEAQDVMQAVFLTLARKAAALRRSESVGGWLHTVAWWLALNVQQSRRSRQQQEATAMREQPTVTATTQPEAGLFRAELDVALDYMPERYRQPLTTHGRRPPRESSKILQSIEPGRSSWMAGEESLCPWPWRCKSGRVHTGAQETLAAVCR
jgi:RNA polymerase sigma factor (sigma-70 family)